MNKNKSAKKKSYNLGVKAEIIAALFLQIKGYRILARREKTIVGEIDLIARRGDILIAVEVKARKSLETAAYAITLKQKQRITRALEIWGQKYPDYVKINKRFDAILIIPWRLPKHIINAW